MSDWLRARPFGSLGGQARTRSSFTRGDWLMKAMLGPAGALEHLNKGPAAEISSKFDAWDETGKKLVGDVSSRCCQSLVSKDRLTSGDRLTSSKKY